eukprot:GHUV01032853.1.p1 GENE.GHUV01032853.1~~GHUV01032853.1.p1  ORF type:complete len:305 (+),score=40.77 GHUV01032853.1:411-1325(+)
MPATIRVQRLSILPCIGRLPQLAKKHLPRAIACLPNTLLLAQSLGLVVTDSDSCTPYCVELLYICSLWPRPAACGPQGPSVPCNQQYSTVGQASSFLRSLCWALDSIGASETREDCDSSMLPTTANGGGQPRRTKGQHGYFSTYFRRIVKPRQMDFEYTFWLMLQLCISPKTAYRHTSYHKQTKNQWARDDPAFVVVLCLLVAMAATAYCVTFGDNLWHSLLTILSAVVVDCLLLGIAIATAGWFIANRFLRKKNLPQHQVEQHLEWYVPAASAAMSCNSCGSKRLETVPQSAPSAAPVRTHPL